MNEGMNKAIVEYTYITDKLKRTCLQIPRAYTVYKQTSTIFIYQFL